MLFAQVRHRVRNTDIQRFHILDRDELMLYLEDVPKFASLTAGVRRYLESERDVLSGGWDKRYAVPAVASG